MPKRGRRRRSQAYLSLCCDGGPQGQNTDARGAEALGVRHPSEESTKCVFAYKLGTTRHSSCHFVFFCTVVSVGVETLHLLLTTAQVISIRFCNPSNKTLRVLALVIRCMLISQVRNF